MLNKEKIILCTIFIIVCFFGNIGPLYAGGKPALFFSDLVDGPRTGLTDDKVTNQGAIVTIWGQNLGSSQGLSKVYVGSDGSGWTPAAHVFYWGDANGSGNGGHANLYERQKMQEISFVVSSSTASGAQKIKVEVGSKDSNKLDFYVRTTGNIYFVRSGGNDNNPGTWEQPWATIADAVTGSETSAGDIVYVTSLTESTGIKISDGWAAGKSGSENNMYAVVAYPGATVHLRAITPYSGNSKYWVVSKFYFDQTVGGWLSLNTNAYGRLISNYITGPEIAPASQSGAISGTVEIGDSISYCKIYGNEIYDWGNASTGNKEHTTYFRIRSNNFVAGYDFGWNYLHSNKARYGIHYYDEGGYTGGFTTPILIHDNWVEDQGGAGINFGGGAGIWTGTVYIYNNILVDTGHTGSPYGQDCNPYAISFAAGLELDLSIYNNLIYGYGQIGNSGSAAVNSAAWQGTWEWKNNIVVDTNNFAYYATTSWINPTNTSKNIWVNKGDAPSWDTAWEHQVVSVTDDMKFKDHANKDFRLKSDSPARDAGIDVSEISDKDFNGWLRAGGYKGDSHYDIGAFEYYVPIPTAK